MPRRNHIPDAKLPFEVPPPRRRIANQQAFAIQLIVIFLILVVSAIALVYALNKTLEENVSLGMPLHSWSDILGITGVFVLLIIICLTVWLLFKRLHGGIETALQWRRVAEIEEQIREGADYRLGSDGEIVLIEDTAQSHQSDGTGGT